MKRKGLIAILLFSVLLNFGLLLLSGGYLNLTAKSLKSYISDNSKDNKFKDVVYSDALTFEILGKYHKEQNYHRLPVTQKKNVRKDVWDLGMHSSGLAVRFKSNSPIITVKWELLKENKAANLTDIAEGGLDLYYLNDGKWIFVNSAIPSGVKNEFILLDNMDGSEVNFHLNLPLYNSVKKLEIGTKKGYNISEPKISSEDLRPIVFYGTSITQGASASRPGMAYPAIIGRKLKTRVLNFGFSGNGRLEEAIGDILKEIDSKLIVIDCTPNSTIQEISERTVPLLTQLRLGNKTTPILLVESIIRENSYLNIDSGFGSLAYIQNQNKELRKAFDEAKMIGIKNIHYLSSDDILGDERESTIDGTHLNDLGHYRFAQAIISKYNEIEAEYQQ